MLLSTRGGGNRYIEKQKKTDGSHGSYHLGDQHLLTMEKSEQDLPMKKHGSACGIPIAAPRLDSSKGPPRKIAKSLYIFWMWKKWPEMAPNGIQEDFVELIPTLPTFCAERTWMSRIFIIFLFFGPQISGFPGPQIS